MQDKLEAIRGCCLEQQFLNFRLFIMEKKNNNSTLLDTLNKSVENKIGKRNSPMTLHSKTTRPVRIYEDTYKVLKNIANFTDTKLQNVVNELIEYGLQNNEKYAKTYKLVQALEEEKQKLKKQ
ncbi:hypothetical protein [Limosilactobacillus mucosae]|uniref:Uncharacterized protein n=1 Tax=Limosilactobacillus mucosae TaxID=97478 RepID=A0AAJ1M9J6_LIMMU|nr:hypothetical protein [Limosilactobacillus mucosae]MDC2828971.1 hypothetical protein [Limosilactobacillus mucosae]